MQTKSSNRERVALLQGTLDLLILHTPLVDHGSLYPALQRLEARGNETVAAARGRCAVILGPEEA